MTDILESGQDIEIMGKSGQRYSGKIYTDKNSSTSLSGQVIVCLTNSSYGDHGWHHTVNSVYNDDVQNALEHFKTRDDVSHMILIPHTSAEFSGGSKVDDLIRNYIHG